MKKRVILTGLVCLVFSGCATGKTNSSAQQAYSVYAWTAPACPSTFQAGREFGFLTILGNLLVGTLIDTALNMAGNALTEAANADKEGWARSGKNARYLYGVRPAGRAFEAVPAACLIIAYAKTPTPAKWCDGPNPIPAMETSCATGRPILEALNSKKLDSQDSHAIKLERLQEATTPPRFYAEIELGPSTDERAVRPEVLQLHYPKPFQKRGSKTRNLVISADMKGMDGKSASVVMVTLKDIEPKQAIDDDDLLRAEVLWAAMPAFDPAKPAPKVDLAALDGHRVGPVNIVAEIRETGQIDKFLQAFAKAFSANTEAASKALKTEFTPGGRQGAEIADEEAAASLQNLQALALKARADVLSTCAKEVGAGDKQFASEAIKQATIAQLQAAEKAAMMSANAAASKAGLDLPYPSTSPTSCPAG